MGRFQFGRRRAPRTSGSWFVPVPPRGGSVVAEVHETSLGVLALALIDGEALEVGAVRAIRVAGDRFLIQTGHGSILLQDAVEAVKRLLVEDAQHQALVAA